MTRVPSAPGRGSLSWAASSARISRILPGPGGFEPGQVSIGPREVAEKDVRMNVIISSCLFCGFIGTDMDPASIPLNSRPKISGPDLIDAPESCSVGSPVSIPVVFGAKSWPQVSDSIIAPILVAMINLSRRMLAMHVHPSEPMGHVVPSLNPYRIRRLSSPPRFRGGNHHAAYANERVRFSQNSVAVLSAAPV
jgi:hypothetical protein